MCSMNLLHTPRERGWRLRIRRCIAAAFLAVLWVGTAPLPGSSAAAATQHTAINGLAPLPYMGWNTYYAHGCSMTDNSIRAAADALVSTGLSALGYNYVWIDCGWWNGSRDGAGNIAVDSAQWPNGMAGIASYIHGKGLKAGIYTDSGINGCGGANQGSYGHYQQDANTFAAWGFDAVKVDYCGGEQQGLNPKTIYGQFRDAILNNSSGRPMLFNICDFDENTNGAVTQWGPFTGNSWRVANDEGPANGVYWSGSGASVLNDLDRASAHPEATAPNHYNDPDYLVAGVPNLTDIEGRSQFSLWAILAAPLMIGADVTNLSSATLTTLSNSEVIAVDQDSAVSQGVKVAEASPGLQVWSKRLAGSGARAVALFNRTGNAANITANFSDLGLTSSAVVRDLWAHRDLGSYNGSYTASVPSHGVVMLKITGTEADWTNAAGILTAAPAAASEDQNDLEAFVRGADGALYHQVGSGSGLAPFDSSSLGGPTSSAFTGSPAVTSWGWGRLDVFVRGNDNTLYHRYYDNGQWSSGWENLGGILSDSPAATSQSSNELDVFVRGVDGALYQKTWNGSSWSGYTDLGGPTGGAFTGAPAATSWGAGRLDVVVRGNDDALWHRSYSGGSWSSWETLGGILSASPAIASRAPGQLDVFVRGGDGALYRDTYSGSWVGFGPSLGGPINGMILGAPAATAWQGRTDVYVQGSDNAMYHRVFP